MEQQEQKQLINKLTEWVKEPSVLDLKRDFEECQTDHAAYIARLQTWDAAFNIKPIPESADKKVQSRISPKLVRKQYEWRCASLSEPFLTTRDLFTVSAVTHEDVPRAKQNELILNYQFECKIGKVEFIDKLIRKCAKEGTAIVRTGWLYEETEVTTEVPVWGYQIAPMEMVEQLQQYVELMSTEPDTFSTLPADMQESVRATLKAQQPVLAVQTGTKTVRETKPKVNRPTVEVCNGRNVYVDPTCEGDIDKAKFVIYSFVSCLADLKADGRYKNLDIAARGMYEEKSPYHTYTDDSHFSFSDVARKKITVYEYYGYYDVTGDDRLTPILACWVGNTLIRLEENPFPDKKPPFVLVPYIPEDDDVRGIPDAELLEDNQKILGAVTRGVIDLLGKSANSQTGVPKGLLDATNLIRFRKGQDYEYNPVNNPQAIFQHKFPEIPQSAMWLIQQQNSDAESLSGVKAFSNSGVSGSGLGDTAAGVRSAMDAASKREMSILRRIASGLLKIGRKMMAMNAVWLTEQEVVRLTNGQFIPVRADDLAGDYDLTLDISTAEADEAKSQDLGFMLQTLGNNMGMEFTQLILAKIAKLKKMPDLAHQIETFKPQPDPLQQQIQQLEIQKLQAEIAKLQAEAQEAMAKSQVQGAKVGVEQARAQVLQGDADLKTQKFVQDQTGESHIRELEKRDLANQGQLDLEVVKGNQAKQAQKFQHNSDLLKSMADAELQGTRQTVKNPI